MKRFMKPGRILLALTLLVSVFAASVPAFAVTFDDTWCERKFKGETLWTSDISPNDFYGHEYDSENGIYRYDWIHQIWDEDHKQLYVQEKYQMTVRMKKILVNQGEFLDSVTYSLGVADYSTDTLITYYTGVDDIDVPEGFGRIDVKVGGYDAVYVYLESKTPGDGNGVMPYAQNDGRIYVPITNAPNQDGRTNTLVINCGIDGYNFDLFDSMLGDYLGLIQALPCTIELNVQTKEFKKGAPTAGTAAAETAGGKESGTENGNAAETAGGKASEAAAESTAKAETGAADSGKTDGDGGKKSSPAVPIAVAAVAAAGVGAGISRSRKKKPDGPAKSSAPKKAAVPKPTEPVEPPRTEEELKKEAYLEKLRDKYGYEDDKELKQAIMRKQIHNETMGYIYQADEAWADAAVDTAEKAKKVADVTIDVAAELSGPEGKAVKNIYTGLTEAAEAAGEIMTGRDAAEAVTEALVDASVGIIENEANGFSQKYAANTLGEGGKKFASAYMETGGDLMKSLEAANEGVQEGAAAAVFDSVTDGLVDSAAAKAVAPAKEAVKESLKSGVNASKTFAQDLVKDSLDL